MRWRAAKIAILSVGCALSFDHASADELMPLRQSIKSGAATAYPFTRCTALFASILQYSGVYNGTGQLKPAVVKNLEAGVVLFSSRAVKLTMQSGFQKETSEDIVRRELDNIVDRYIFRFQNNAAKSGQPFGLDALVNDDLDLCTEILGTTSE